MKTVLVTGTFDGLHPGHLNFFDQAKQLGDKLIVIVARDTTVVKVKGHVPTYSEAERLDAIHSAGIVDAVVLGHESDPYQAVADINPDVLALGYDQEVFTDNLKNQLAQYEVYPEIVRLKAFKPEIYKSSLLNTQQISETNG